MEFFKRAKAVRLRSQHKKYMVAHDDEENVKQSRNGSSKAARWSVEPVEGKSDVIRLKSCQSWKYLSASEDPFLLGMTGKKVVHASPRLRFEPAVEWEPVKEGHYVKLRTHRGNFLRANGGVPPWMNSITHDLPSRSATQDWILWTVDVLEVDYQSTVEMESLAESNVVEDLDQNRDPGRGSFGLSRNSSYSSSVSESKSEEVYNDYYEAGSPAASVKSVRSFVDQHSSSFNKLKSMLDDLHDLLDNAEQDEETTSLNSFSHPHPLEVKMAKQTLKELNNLDFADILSSDRDKKLEKAISILIADEKSSSMSSKGQLISDLIYLQGRLKSLRSDHESASRDLVEYATFSARRMDVKAQLKKDAAKAHELETMEVGFNNMLVNARAKREELLKQLEAIDNSIRAAERAQADNGVEIEELISRIGKKSETLREMEREEKLWNQRKIEAKYTLERVEDDWVKVKRMFHENV